jgi:hypothetical protein
MWERFRGRELPHYDNVMIRNGFNYSKFRYDGRITPTLAMKAAFFREFAFKRAFLCKS